MSVCVCVWGGAELFSRCFNTDGGGCLPYFHTVLNHKISVNLQQSRICTQNIMNDAHVEGKCAPERSTSPAPAASYCHAERCVIVDVSAWCLVPVGGLMAV